VYQYEKYLHKNSNLFEEPYISSTRESTTASVNQADLVLRGRNRNIIFEFKMDCKLREVADDAVKLFPSVKLGDVAYLINVKSMSYNELSELTTKRTDDLNKEIKKRTDENYGAYNIVPEFEFVSQAGKPKNADVLCMWEVRA